MVTVLMVGLIVGLAFAFVQQTRSHMQARMAKVKEDLKAKRKAGQLEPAWEGVDLDNLQLNQLGMRLTRAEMTSVEIADFLAAYSYLLIALVLAACWGITTLASRWLD
jgi:hypothetical protein